MALPPKKACVIRPRSAAALSLLAFLPQLALGAFRSVFQVTFVELHRVLVIFFLVGDFSKPPVNRVRAWGDVAESLVILSRILVAFHPQVQQGTIAQSGGLFLLSRRFLA